MSNPSDVCEVKRHVRPQNNAARERSRVRTLRSAFLELQRSLPAVPPNTKLSKLDILVLATAYIYHLTRTLEDQDQDLVEPVPSLPKNSDGPHRSQNSTSKDRQNIADELLQDNPSGMPYRSERVVMSHSSKMLTLASITRHAMKAKRMKLHRELNSESNPLYTGNPHNLSSADIGYHDDALRIEGYNSECNRFYHHDKETLSHRQVKRDDKDVACLSSIRPQGTVGVLHPVKKWPMRSRLYDSILGCPSASIALLTSSSVTSTGCVETSGATGTHHGKFTLSKSFHKQ